MADPEKEFALRGLEPDNPLAFLALLGLLRALDTSRPSWSSRSFWRPAPWRPVLALSTAVDLDDLVAAAGEGVVSLAEAHDFGGLKDISLTRTECRELLQEVLREGREQRIELFASLMSDGAVNDKNEIVAPPLSTMSGQGHQHFLVRLADIPRGVLPTALAKKKRRLDLNAPSYLAAALFDDWKRNDETDSFRWDFAEDRRYALRDRDPSTDSATTEHGANRLASIALPLFPAVPTGRKGAGALAARSFRRQRDRRQRLSWPIWVTPRSLRAIVAMLDLPALHGDDIDLSALDVYDIAVVYRSYRIMNGYFANFTRAHPLVTSSSTTVVTV